MANITASSLLNSGTSSADNITISSLGNVTVYGGSGNDTIQGADADASELVGSSYLIYGEDGNDSIIGDVTAETIYGGAGDDVIRSYEGNDLIRTNADNDDVLAGDGDDTIYGNMGQDTLYGDAGNDVIRGGKGLDYIDGGTGDDNINGNAGFDQLRGNTGADTFVFSFLLDEETGTTQARDYILDFSRTEGDKIGLAGGLTFDDLIITNSGQAMVTFTDHADIEHQITLVGVNINLVESDFTIL